MTKIIKREWLKTERLYIERWEDEGGGQMVENQLPVHNHDPLPVPPIRGGSPGTSMQWNEQFAIEPIQVGYTVFSNRIHPARRPPRKGKANG